MGREGDGGRGRGGEGATGRMGREGELQIENCKLRIANCKLQIDLIVKPCQIFNFQFAILNLQFSPSPTRLVAPSPRLFLRFCRESADQIEGSDSDVDDVINGSQHQLG